MNKKFIYFINPISGTGAKSFLSEIIKNKTTEKNIPFEILHTNAAGEYQFLKEKIATEKITDVIICGGDGTVNQIAGALLGIDINIGIIPMGSGNGMAFAAKIPKRIDKALEIIFTGKTSLVDSFYINHKFSCMLCGLGFDAQVAHDFAKQKKRGLLTYIKLSIKNFIAAKTFPFELILDGQFYISEQAPFFLFGKIMCHLCIKTQAAKHTTKFMIDIKTINK